METKDEAVKDGLYEEATILQRRETDYRAELAGNAESGSSLPIVDSCDIESIVAAWTGIPVERMGQDEMARLVQLVGLGLRHDLNLCCARGLGFLQSMAWGSDACCSCSPWPALLPLGPDP